MSATTDTNEIKRTKLKITDEEITAAIKGANRPKTLELIRDITGAKGVLSDELRSRFEQHPLYEALEQSDRDTLIRAAEAGVMWQFRGLLTGAVVALREGKALYPTGWEGLGRRVTNMLAAEVEEHQVQKPRALREGVGQAKGQRLPRRGGKKDRREQAAAGNR
jgi:hypothetical protein